MARDYVTIREEQRGGQAIWTEPVVGRARLKSAPARVTRKDGKYRIAGAAWGGPIASVEVKVDGGPRITSRATDTAGNIQPAMTDPAACGVPNGLAPSPSSPSARLTA